MVSSPVRFFALSLVTLCALAVPRAADAARLVVLCSNGYRAVMEELGPQFERATSHTLEVTYGLSAALQKQIADGAPFDVAVLTPASLDDLIAKGRIVGPTRTVLAQSPIAIAIRAGAPRPDVATKDALLRTLQASPSIAYAKEGAGGVFFVALAERLGIASALAPKTRTTVTGVEVAAAVARGEAALGIMPMSEILPAPGVEVLGTFPGDTKGAAIMVAGVRTGSPETTVAKTLFAFLTTQAVLPVLTRKGMER